MKKLSYYFFACCTLLFNLININVCKATHFAGVDLTYAYTGSPNTYLVTLKLYRDCCPSCTAFDPTYPVCFSSALLGIQDFITVAQIPGTGGQIPLSPCVNTSQCYEEYIYQATVILPQASTDWVFTYNGFARNNAITTLLNPGNQGLAVRAFLDNSTFPTNSSPVFSFIPIQRFCVGNQFYFDQGATDPDNDSLVFSFSPAEGDNTQLNPQTCPFTSITNLIYNSPYSPTNPIATSSGITIDSQTGLISFVPALQQIGIICVKVEEYQNGIFKGSVKRDIQVVTEAACNVLPPTFEPSITQNGIIKSCNDSTLILSFVEPIQCGSATTTDIRAIDANGLPNPVISVTPINCVNGLTDSLLVSFYFPFSLDTTYLFTKIGNDNNTFLSICGSQMPEFDSIWVIVTDTSNFTTASVNVGCFFSEFTVNFSQEISCGTVAADLSDFSLTDVNGANIPISAVTNNCNPLSQYSSSSQFTFQFTNGVSALGPLYLITHTGTDQNTIASKCGTFLDDGDTLAIINVINEILVELGSDITACSSNLPVLNAGNSGVSFSWYLDGVLLSDTTQTITAGNAGLYQVFLNYGASCTGTDSIRVTFINGPVVNIGPDTSICATDILILNAHNPGATYQWYYNGAIISGATDSLYAPTQTGNYSVTVSNAINCSASAQVNVTVYSAAPIPNVIDQAYCTGTAIPALNANVSGVGYQWFDNTGGLISGATGITFQPTAPGTYSVTVYAGSCTASDQGTVSEVVTPSPTLSNISICSANNYPLLNANSNLPGFTYQWLFNNNSITGATDSIYQTSQQTGVGTYSIIVQNTQSGITCQASASMTLSLNPSLPVALGGNQSICSGDSISLDAQNSGTSYQWSTGSTNQIIQVNQSGVYTVTVTDANGCTGSDSVQISVNVPAIISITSNSTIVDNTIFVCKLEPFPVLNAVVPSGSPVSWEYNGIIISTANSVQVADQAFGIYQVTIMDANLCKSIATIEVAAQPCEIIVYNIITPNNDGKNDVFFIENIETHSKNIVQIFNRWGNKVFDKSDYNNTSNVFKGEDLPDGTYFYVITTPDDGNVYKGGLNIISDIKK